MLHIALAATDAPFDADFHARTDLHPVRVEIEGAEGETVLARLILPAGVDADVAATPWLWLSVSRDGGVAPLFRGRSTGPRRIDGAMSVYEFDARPADLADRLADLLSAAAVPPFADPLFRDPAVGPDPVEALDGRHAHLCIEPATGEAVLSDAVTGRARFSQPITPAPGLLDLRLPAAVPFHAGQRLRLIAIEDAAIFAEGVATVTDGADISLVIDRIGAPGSGTDWLVALAPAPSALDGATVEVEFADVPIAELDLSVEIAWVQEGTGTLDLSPRIRAAAGGPIRTLSPAHDFADAWPTPGDAFAGTRHLRVAGAALVSQAPNGVWQEARLFPRALSGAGAQLVRLPVQVYAPDLSLAWRYGRRRRETARIVLSGSVAAGAGLTGRSERLHLRLGDLAADESAPDSLRRGAFFETPRGQQALSHAVHVAAVRIAESQRAVTVRADILGLPPELIGLGCDRVLALESPALPGGAAVGKLRRFTQRFSAEGISTRIEILCSVGSRAALPPLLTAPDYVDETYAEPGHFAGADLLLGAGDLSLAVRADAANPAIEAPAHLDRVADALFVETVGVRNQADSQTQWLRTHGPFGALAFADDASGDPAADIGLVPTALTVAVADSRMDIDAVREIGFSARNAIGRFAGIRFGDGT